MAINWSQSYHVWSSSKPYILLTMTFAILVGKLFSPLWLNQSSKSQKRTLKTKTDTFLATFIVPILPYILETRIGFQGTKIQSSISIVLSIFGLSMMVFSPFIGIFIDRFATRKWPLVIGLVAQIMATWLTAAATNSKSLSVQACICA